jgi:hypothetical protein
MALTAIMAYAIALVPRLKWGFLCIALLPSALYGRAVINADGATLATAMVVTALGLRRLYLPLADRLAVQAAWMALCVLTKPPQVVFVMLQASGRSLIGVARNWRPLAVVVIPAVILAVAWTVLGSSDVALWRIADRTQAQQFEWPWLMRSLQHAQSKLVHPFRHGRACPGHLDRGGTAMPS